MSMIENGNIITLENEKEYLILEGMTYNDTDYVYTVLVDENEMPTPNGVELFQVVKVDGDEYLQGIQDQKFKKVLEQVFLKSILEELMTDW